MTQINELLWSPFSPNKFIVFGNYIMMQQMNLEKNQLFFEKLWLRTDFPIIKCVSWGKVNIEKNCNQLECLAIGRSTGHISLIKTPAKSEGLSLCQPMNFADIEITPTHNRPVNALAWNTNYTHLIGALYERHRSDFALMVWDLNAKGFDQTTKNHPQNYSNPVSSDESTNNVVPQKSHATNSTTHSFLPLYSTGYAEAMSSFAWLPSTPNALIAGQNYKQLKIYDLRVSPSNTTLLSTSSPTPATPSTLTKAVNGINFDPMSPHRLSSYVEDQLYLWDLRNFDKPTSIITSPDFGKPILKTAWCMSRRNLMAVLLKESDGIKFIDFNLNPSGTYKCVYDRTITSGDSVTSFAWHTLTGDSILAITSTGSLHNVAFQEKISMDYSSRGLLAVQSGSRTSSYLGPSQETFRQGDNLFGDVTKRQGVRQLAPGMRALTLDRGVLVDGGQVDLHSIVSEDIVGAGVRRADHLTTRLLSPFQRDTFDDDKLLEPDTLDDVEDLDGDTFVCRGVRDTFVSLREHDNASSVRGYPSSSSLRFLTWQGLDLPPDRDGIAPSSHYIEYYVSESRDRILAICDWDSWLTSPKYDEHIQSLLKRGENDVAVAFTVFRGDIRTALDILNDWVETLGRTSEVESCYASNVAAVLAGFSPQVLNALWLGNARRLLNSSTARSPYLLAALAFLLTQTSKYHHDAVGCDINCEDFIVNDPRIRLKDRVAFGCLFMDDIKFRRYLLTATEDHIVRGDLEGLILTGLDDGKAVCLLQNYVNRTLDVLTVSMLAIKSGCVYLLSHPTMLNWMDTYRTLLDRNRLWERRAEFDTEYYQVAKTKLSINPPQQVFVACNYCGRQIVGGEPVASTLPPEPSTTPREENYDDSPTSNSSTSGGRGLLFKEAPPSLKTSSISSSTTSSNSQPAPPQSNKKAGSNCPGCGKSLPRCAICLLNMNACQGSLDFASADQSLYNFALPNLFPTTKFTKRSSEAGGGDKEEAGSGMGANSVSDWFSWCQRCAHGGHALHMFQWFESNTECPVSGCECLCWEPMVESKLMLSP